MIQKETRKSKCIMGPVKGNVDLKRKCQKANKSLSGFMQAITEGRKLCQTGKNENKSVLKNEEKKREMTACIN